MVTMHVPDGNTSCPNNHHDLTHSCEAFFRKILGPLKIIWGNTNKSYRPTYFWIIWQKPIIKCEIFYNYLFKMGPKIFLFHIYKISKNLLTLYLIFVRAISVSCAHIFSRKTYLMRTIYYVCVLCFKVI